MLFRVILYVVMFMLSVSGVSKSDQSKRKRRETQWSQQAKTH